MGQELPTVESDQFKFAEWKLVEKGEVEPMQKLVERLEQTRVGRQLTRGRKLLEDNSGLKSF